MPGVVGCFTHPPTRITGKVLLQALCKVREVYQYIPYHTALILVCLLWLRTRLSVTFRKGTMENNVPLYAACPVVSVSLFTGWLHTKNLCTNVVQYVFFFVSSGRYTRKRFPQERYYSQKRIMHPMYTVQHYVAANSGAGISVCDILAIQYLRR